MVDSAYPWEKWESQESCAADEILVCSSVHVEIYRTIWGHLQAHTAFIADSMNDSFIKGTTESSLLSCLLIFEVTARWQQCRNYEMSPPRICWHLDYGIATKEFYWKFQPKTLKRTQIQNFSPKIGEKGLIDLTRAIYAIKWSKRHQNMKNDNPFEDTSPYMKCIRVPQKFLIASFL